MRSYNSAFAAALAAKSKEPRFAVQLSFSDAVADDVWIKSHGDIDLAHQLTAFRWEFTNTADGWTAHQAVATNHATYINWAPSASNPDFISPDNLNFAGGTYRRVRARIRRTAAGGTWEGTLYYIRSGTSFAGALNKTIAVDPTLIDTGQYSPDWFILEWDMTAVSGGAADDWVTGTIKQLRIDLVSTAAGAFDIDWIQVGGEPTVLDARTQRVSVLSQQLYPDDGRATIGSFSFDALDVDGSLTTAQRDALNVDAHGLRNKLARLYVGFRDLDFDDFEVYTTQMVYGTKYAAKTYSFTCQDIQRAARKSVFDTVTLALAQPIDAVTTTIPIAGDTSLIQALEHDAAFTDAPSSTVAYVKIDREIIRIPAAGIVANQFTGVTRGALGTLADAHDTDATVSSDQQKKVEEVIYLEMNAVKLARAVLTGVLANQATFMPDSWHAGVDEAFLDIDSFDNIGDDLYDGTDDGGVVLRFLGLSSDDAKGWVEKQICRVIGCYMPVRADGRLALQRLERVLHGAAPIVTVTDQDIIGGVDVTYAMNQIYNRLEIDWNAVDGDATRFTAIDDQESIDKWTASDVKVIEAFGLHGSRHSSDVVRQLFERFRDRYSGPPATAQPRLRLASSAIEVGDIVRVVSASARDFTDPRSAGDLDRSFEVQSTSLDWMNGVFKVSLFGSTEAAQPLDRAVTQQAIPDAWFDDLGTNIAGLSGVTLTGGVYHMTTSKTFAGGATNDLSGSCWYILGDLQIDAGVTLTISGNVQIRVLGVLTVNGTINGAGNGLAGVADTLDASGWPYLNMAKRTPWNGLTCQLGQAGYYGSPRAGGGLFERTRLENTGGESWADIQSFAAPATEGLVDIVPTLQIGWDGTQLIGVPNSLLGSSGGPGGKRHWSNTRNTNTQQINAGGTGGASGAGLLVVCRGMAFGVAGLINLSGADGSLGGYDAGNSLPGHAGAGAGGAPGAFVCIVDGVLNPLPLLSDATFIANYGATPDPADPPGFNDMQTAWLSDKLTLPGGDRPQNARSYFRSPTSSLKAGLAAARALFLSAAQAYGDDYEDPGRGVFGGDTTTVNASFELGNQGWQFAGSGWAGPGWSIVLDEANALDGRYVAVNSSTTGLNEQIRNVVMFPVTPGSIVRFGGGVKTDSSFVAGASIGILWFVSFFDSSGASLGNTTTPGTTAANTPWSIIRNVAIAPPNAASVQLGVCAYQSAGRCYADAGFVQVTENFAPLVNVLPPWIADFESAQRSDFNLYSNGSVVVDTTLAYAGTRSLKMIGPTTSGQDWGANFTAAVADASGNYWNAANIFIPPNRRWLLACRVYPGNADSQGAGVSYTAYLLAPTGAHIDSKTRTLTGSGAWQFHVFEIDARSSSLTAVLLTIKAHNNSARGSAPSLNVDACRLVDVTDLPWFTESTFGTDFQPGTGSPAGSTRRRVQLADSVKNNNAAVGWQAGQDHLAEWDIEPATTFSFEVQFSYTSGATPDLAIQLPFSLASPASIYATIQGVDANGGAVNTAVSNLDSTPFFLAGGSGIGSITVRGTFTSHATNRGILAFGWAQNTANASNSVLLKNSTMVVQRTSP